MIYLHFTIIGEHGQEENAGLNNIADFRFRQSGALTKRAAEMSVLKLAHYWSSTKTDAFASHTTGISVDKPAKSIVLVVLAGIYANTA